MTAMPTPTCCGSCARRGRPVRWFFTLSPVMRRWRPDLRPSRGYVLSFPGVVTFKNAPALRAAAAVTPLDHVLVETDAPFLTPHPHRGRPNSPRLLPLTAEGWPPPRGSSRTTLARRPFAQRRERVFGLPTS